MLSPEKFVNQSLCMQLVRDVRGGCRLGIRRELRTGRDGTVGNGRDGVPTYFGAGFVQLLMFRFRLISFLFDIRFENSFRRDLDCGFKLLRGQCRLAGLQKKVAQSLAPLQSQNL